MKQKKLFLVLFLILISFNVFGQVGITQNFNSSSFPTGWTASPSSSPNSTSTCEGSHGVRYNLYSSKPTFQINTTSTATSNGEDITVSFDYKLINYSGGTATTGNWGTIEVEYSIDGGSTYTTFHTINSGNHTSSTSCANVSEIIPGASVPSSSSMRFRWKAIWATGDYYFQFDNVSITQPVFTPPNCTTLSSPSDAATSIAATTDLTWTAATGIPTGYKIDLGTTTGGTDILNDYDAGLVTTYNLPNDLTYNTTYYATVKPYNGNGSAVGCTETTFTTKDGCITPTTPSNGSSTASINQTISWSSYDAGVVKYIVSIGTTAGGTDILNAHDNGTVTSYAASGLSYSTQYYVSIKAENANGLTTAACTGYSFTTRTDPTLTPPFIQNFSSYLPTDWTEAAGLLAAPTTFTSTSSSLWELDGFGNVGSSGAAKMNIYSTGRDEWLITPPINLGNGSINYQLEFDLALTYYNNTNSDVLGSDDEFSVVISTDNGATWTSTNILQEWGSGDAISNTGEHVIIDLSSYTGIVKLGFYAESTVSGGDVNVYVDNVEVKEIPACAPVYNVGVSAYTDVSVAAIWDAVTGATAYDWQVVPFGDAPGTNVVASGTAYTNSANMAGLSGNTDYDIYVRNNCGGGTLSAWSDEYSFTTTCTPVATFTEGFESYTSSQFPVCFNKVGSGTVVVNTTSSSANTGSNSFRLYGYQATAALPVVSNLAAQTHRLKFYARATSSYDLKIGYLTDDSDSSTFVELETISTSTSYSLYVVNYPNTVPSGTRMAFQTTSSSPSYYIDDMVWEPIPTTPPTCSVISSPADEATSISVTTSLSWSANIDATGYKLKIGTSAGASDFLAETDLGDVTTYNPSPDFAYNTEYFLTLTAYNANGDATGCTETSFTTNDGCKAPYSPSNNATSVSITPNISWYSVTGSTGYVISIGTTAGGTDIVNAHDNGTSTSYSVTGLSYSTQYFVTVQAKNAQGTTSAACTGYSFTTKAGPQSLPYTQDFEGDTSEIVITGTNTNKFYIGTAANNGGAKSLYVSDDSGTSNEYNTSSTSTAWASVDVDLTGHSAAILSFDWRCSGEAGYDYGEVWINTGNSDVLISYSKEFKGSNTYQNKSIDLTSHVGQVVAIKFKWYNDYSAGSQPPLSIDNISITGTPSMITWNNQSWSNTSGPTATDDAMVIDDITLSADLNCKDLSVAAGKTLTVASGTVLNVTGDLTNNGSIVFASDASGTGIFAAYSGSAVAGSGSVEVQQYVGAKRAWRMLTSPLKGASNNSIYYNWQNGGVEVSGTGMNLFGPSGTGLHTGPSYSIKKYPTSSAATSWTNITNTQTESLFDATKNNAFVVFTTSPFTTTATNITSGSSAVATVYHASGSLITGDVSYASLPTDIHTLIGNPYVSPIDPADMISDNANFDHIWVWDPSISTFGGYLTYDASTGWSNETASYSNASGVETLIQSGQAFFVKPTTSSTFTLKETHKSSLVDNGVFFKTSSSVVEQVRVVLNKQVQGNWQNEDAAVIVLYANGNNGITNKDAEKMIKGGENISVYTNQQQFSIEHRALAQNQDEVQLYLNGMNDAALYKFALYTKDYSGIQPYLWDTLEDTYYVIPSDGTVYEHNFTVLNPDDEKQRFRVVFSASLSASIDNLAASVAVYPNPVTNGMVTIDLPVSITTANYAFINMLGQKVYEGKAVSGQNQVYLQNVSAGVYSVHFTVEGKDFSKKIIVK